MARVVGEISLGPPLGVDRVGQNAVTDPKQTNKHTQELGDTCCYMIILL